MNVCRENRELSWLKFNDRVLLQAKDPQVPLAEKLSFISIYQTNLDEFFMVRIGSLYDQMLFYPDSKDNKTGMTGLEQLKACLKKVHYLNKKKDRIYENVMSELGQSGWSVILGEVGKNFAAGMSGGIAYVLDRENDLYTKLNKSLVGFGAVTKPEDVAQLKGLIEEHVAWTDSKLGKKILKNFDTCLPHFKKIVPHDYAKMLDSIAEFEAEGMSREEAQIEAFYANTRN